MQHMVILRQRLYISGQMQKKPFMGLTSFAGELPALKDIGIAKNYLEESELKVLNNLVSGYFDMAEINAIEHKPMYMDDYCKAAG